MARSDDPTTFSQTWQDAPQGYASGDALTQQPQPSYADPHQGYGTAQPAAADPAYYAQAPETHQHYADSAQQPVAEAYPPLDPSVATYGEPAHPQGYHQQPAADGYATYDQPTGAPEQVYQQSPQTYEQAAPHAYAQPATQPSGYQQTDLQPVAYQQETHAAQPPQAYGDQPVQGYNQVPEQPQSVVYSDYAPAAQQHEPYAQQDGYPTTAPVQPDPYAASDPFAAPTSGFSDYNTPAEPAFGVPPQQDYAPQSHFQGAPQGQDPYAFQQQASANGLDYGQLGGQPHLQTGQPGEQVLDPGLFSQPEPTGPAQPLGESFDRFSHAGQHFQDPQQQYGQPGPGHQPGFDQRFDPQQHGYDQRFEQPHHDQYAHDQYNGGLVGDFAGQDQAHDMGTAVAPVVADQQLESSRGRRGLIIVGALVTAVGIGGALGFAYKYSNESGRTASGTPPTIKASKTAAKEAPAKTFDQNDTFGTRLATNRASDRTKTRLESREEPLAGQPAGVKLRSSTSGQTNGTQVTSLQNDSRANVPGVRRVKTLKVNPDGTFAAPTASTFGGSDNSIPGVTIGSIPTVSKPKAKRIVVPESLQTQAETTRKTVATLPKATTTTAIPAPKPVTSRKRVASLQPAAPATATNSGGGLGYVVQVSARRSRIDALAAFADLQQRYTSALSSKQPDIQEVNLGGTRGKWYRVRIGPPGSKTAAYNLCNRLKKSGLKDCLIKAY